MAGSQGGNRDAEDRLHDVGVARIWRDMPKIVFSKTLQRAGSNTTIVRELVPGEIQKLKAQPGGDLVVGGADLAAGFRAHDLIDEYRIYVHPVLLGRGRPLFQPSDSTTRRSEEHTSELQSRGHLVC